MFGAVASMFCALACLLCMRVVLRRTLELQRQLTTEAKPEPEPEPKPELHAPRPQPRRRVPMPPPFDLYEATELLPMPTEQVDVRALLRASKA